LSEIAGRKTFLFAWVCCVSGRQDTLDPVDVLFRWRVRVL
jgi:hypothetical protein